MNQVPAGKRRGNGWLVVAVLVVAGGAVAVVWSERVRAAIGISAMPGDAGTEPGGDAAHGEASVAARGHDAMMPASGVTLAPVGASPAAATSSAAVAPEAPTAPAGISQGNEVEAIEALEAGQRALATLAWADAGTRATRAASLAQTSGTKERAGAMQTFARQAQAAFARLDERDELRRNWDTHPSLVRIGDGDTARLAVPLDGVQPAGSEPVVAAGDPVAFIEKLRQGGDVHAMVKARNEFIATVIPGTTYDVTRIDVGAVLAQRRTELTARLAELGTGAPSGDALAWYAAARFAYRNRIDDLVSAPLSKAFALDAGLVDSVRDDKAARLFASLVFHVTNANRTQAAAYYTRIIPAYADTEHGQQAEAYWKRRQSAPAPAAAPADPVAPVGSAGADPEVDAKGPDAEFAAGRDAYAKAQQLPLTDARNALYREAIAHFDQAITGYAALLAKSPDDVTLQNRMCEAKMLRYGGRKYLTDFE